MFDYRAGIFLFVFMLHMRLWTLGLMIIAMLILWAVEKRGLSMPVAMRRARLWFVGPYRPALGKVHHRDFRDYG